MSRIVQEKFEIQAPPNANDDASGSWRTDKSARDRQGLQTRGGMGRFEPYRGDLYNTLPPGMDIEDQEVFRIHRQDIAKGGLGSGTQQTEDVTRKSLAQGFDRKPMSPTDDMYTREHNDCFYDEVTVDGVTGFVERNNMLDRL